MVKATAKKTAPPKKVKSVAKKVAKVQPKRASKKNTNTTNNQSIVTELESLIHRQEEQELSIQGLEEDEEEEDEEEEEEEEELEGDEDSMVIEIERQGFLYAENNIKLSFDKPITVVDITGSTMGQLLSSYIRLVLSEKGLPVHYLTLKDKFTWKSLQSNSLLICDYDSVDKYRYLLKHLNDTTVFLFCSERDEGHIVYCNLPLKGNTYCVIDEITLEKAKNIIEEVFTGKKESNKEHIQVSFGVSSGNRKQDNELFDDAISPFQFGSKRKDEDISNHSLSRERKKTSNTCFEILKQMYLREQRLQSEIFELKSETLLLKEHLHELFSQTLM